MSMATPMREFEFRSEDFRFIATLVVKQTGIVLTEHKKDMVYARIARRIRSLGFRSFDEYCELLKDGSNQEELIHFVNALTTNMTSFFREGHHFAHFKAQLSALKQSARIRMWSAACSSGAEPYSMAMTVLEAIPDAGKRDIKILATDIDTSMLAKSKAGIYSAQEADGIPPALAARYTERMPDGSVQMKAALKNIITFKPLNLIGAWPFKGPFQAVFCRNVIIYFSKETQRELFTRMEQYLPDGGWLYLGHSESLHGVNESFVSQGRTIYQKASA